MIRACVWFLAAVPFWIGGALVGDPLRQLGLWLVALAIEYTAPLVFLRVPFMGRSTPADWLISGTHMSERCGLFIIIALGEGLIITGATYSTAAPQPWLDSAMLTAFIGSFVMWWLYFDMGARRGARHIEQHTSPGMVGRQAFTYWHIPIVAGIIILAVADELVLAHPQEAVHTDFLAIVIGGTLSFIAGLAGFKRISSGNPWFPASHVYGIYALVPIALWGRLAHPPSLVLYMAVIAIFMMIAIWEWGSFHGGWMERMERRNMWLGRFLRRRLETRRARRVAKEAEKAPRG